MKVPAFGAWLVYLGAVLVLLLAEDLLPLRPTFVTPAAVHPLLLASEVAFVLFAWPFLGGGGTAGERVLRAATLSLLALPPALVAGNISGVEPGIMIRGRVLVFALATLALALRHSPHYLLGAFLLSAGLPLLAFLASEFAGGDLGWLACLSPVWAAVETGRWTSLALAGFAAAGTALLTAVDRPESAA